MDFRVHAVRMYLFHGGTATFTISVTRPYYTQEQWIYWSTEADALIDIFDFGKLHACLSSAHGLQTLMPGHDDLNRRNSKSTFLSQDCRRQGGSLYTQHIHFRVAKALDTI